MAAGKQQQQLALSLQAFYQNPIAKVSLELFLTIACILFFALAAIKPTLLTMAELIKEIDDKKQLDQDLGQKIAALSSAQQEYQIMQNRISVLDQAIPSQEDVVYDLKVIEKLAGEEGLAIGGMQVDQLPQEKELAGVTFDKLKLTQLNIRLNITGSYQTIRSFAERLRQNRRIILVESINFSIAENRGNRSLSASMNLVLPYYSSAKEPVPTK